MSDPKALAASLRAMHAARTQHFVTDGGVAAFSIVAIERRMYDLLLAADALEQGWVIQCENQSVSEIKAEAAAEVLERLRYAAQSELAKWKAAGHNTGTATTAILALCERLGVTL